MGFPTWIMQDDLSPIDTHVREDKLQEKKNK